MPMPNNPLQASSTMTKTYTLNFTGDVMLARLIDQLFPQHNHSPRENHITTTFQTNYPHLAPGNYTHASPWGSALPLFQPPSSSLNLINLETAVTTAAEPWPDKRFNYRMHPANLEVLRAGCVDFASLANNHTLDFGTEGLVETVWAVKGLGLGFAAAGESVDECRRAAVLDLPRKVSRVSAAAAADSSDGRRKWSEKEKHGGHGHDRFDSESNGNGTAPASTTRHKIHVYAASDHPRDWSGVPTFHLIDYSSATRRHLKTLLSSPSYSPEEGREKPALKIFSIHWGPNYTWQPSSDIRSLAHFLIDECAVDIVHGHSAHHVQGVERYKGKLIMYGCGDFVDDYALNERFRNDLGAVWRVVVAEEDRGDGGDGLGLRLERLEVYPTRCDRFQVTLLDREDEDHGWVRRKITALSEETGTGVRRELGDDGQIVVDLN